jgi:hypothetical protein
MMHLSNTFWLFSALQTGIQESFTISETLLQFPCLRSNWGGES